MEQTAILLWVLIGLCYVGIGFVLTFLADTIAKHFNPGERLKNPGQRVLVILLWPIFAIIYIACGLKE